MDVRSASSHPARTIVVGAGVGGLAAAIDLASHGCAVTVIESAEGPGGKIRCLEVGERRVDAGPTVLTMRWVFDELFARAGRSFDDHVTLDRAAVLARHVWCDGSFLDLFANHERTVESVATFAGGDEADRYRAFMRYARRIYEAVEEPFLRSQRPNLARLLRHVGARGFAPLVHIDPTRSMWRALCSFFRDPRLRQLFARYATYCGSSPFSAPATLHLIAHVESQGVYRVRGGMVALSSALAEVARALGVDFVFRTRVGSVRLTNGRASAVETTAGERIEADAIVLGADVSGVAAGLFGADAAASVRAPEEGMRSLSAMTWAAVARTGGVQCAHHNVFFSPDCATEFRELFAAERVPDAPTVYVCAQDRGDEAGELGEERLLLIVNAPATGDDPSRWSQEEVERCERAAFATLSSCGLKLSPRAMVHTTPIDFERLYPETGGALYGRRTSGVFSTLSRPSSQTSVPRLYLAGGTVHPGPGVPMAALSGMRAAESVLSDLASTHRLLPAATAGST